MPVQEKTISILGCGWLGLPLGACLSEAGCHVKGSTTTPDKLQEISEAGIEPYLLRVGAEVDGDRVEDFFASDILFLNIPPGRRQPGVRERYPEQVEAVCRRLVRSAVSWVLFAGSTSVYPSLNRVVAEEDADSAAGPTAAALLDAERLLFGLPDCETTVLRFSGLYGYTRRLGRFLSGKKDLRDGDAPVNLIHRDDCIRIVAEVLARNVRGVVLNACSDSHPMRRDLYAAKALQQGLEPPVFAESSGEVSYKIVSNQRLKETLDYRFLYPDPLAEAP